ncbi:MAG TPA: glycosyltransferase family 4 protein, partial [Patescibacteria group bacterium]
MKILYHGDSPAVTTGFGTVAKNLLNGLVRLNPEIEITVLGINDHGGWKDPNEYPYKIFPAVFTDPKDIMGFKRLINIIQGTDPEIPFDFDSIIFSFDSWLFANTTIGDYTVIQTVKDLLQQKEEETGKHVKTILYTPIDNHQILPGWIQTMQVFDEVIVPSFYGKRIITNHNKELGDRTRVIYNGLDTKNFYPIEKKTRTIKGIYEFSTEGKFVIGFVGRNSWRKNYFHLIKIFSLFKEKHPDAFLYLHCQPVSYEHDGIDILELCKYYGLTYSDDYYIPLDHKEGAGITRHSMNDVYNSMDVFLST